MKGNNELTPAQESFRRGDTTYHAKRALLAKAALASIRSRRGSTKEQIMEDIGVNSLCGALDMLKQHGLIFHTGSPRIYWSTGRNPI